MFQSKEYIARHRGKKGPDREDYLRQLVQEYNVTDSLESKQQILANLGNFAYDPINYVWLWNLKVVDLFLDAITGQDQLLQEFGMGGLSNICLDPLHHTHILSEPYNIRAIMECIFGDQSKYTNDTVVNAMTLLMLLIDPISKKDILTVELRDQLRIMKKDDNPCKSIVASLFLEDYFRETA